MVIKRFSTQPTWKEWLILKNISVLKDQSPTYKKMWAERINVKSTNPIYVNAINLLVTEGIATTKPWIANCQILEINLKLLDEYIENSEIYREFHNYVYSKELFVMGV